MRATTFACTWTYADLIRPCATGKAGNRRPLYALIGGHGKMCAVADQIASLRQSLEAQRRQGIGFDQAWSVAIAEVPNSGWRTRDVIASTREAWKRAYLRQPPTPAERKLLRAARALAELERERLDPERRLPRPGPPLSITDTSHRQARQRQRPWGEAARSWSRDLALRWRLAGAGAWPNSGPNVWNTKCQVCAPQS